MSSSGGGPVAGGQQPQPGGGPPENPIVKWYREWSARTPLVTRRTLQMIVGLWVVTFFADLSIYIVNIPFYTILHFEVYRLLLAPLYTPGILSVLFICMSLSQMGTRLEGTIGSTAFASMMGMIALLTNIIFIAACFLLWAFGMSEALFYMAESFWLVVMGLIAVECVQSAVPTRQLFMLPFQIPSVYFPLVLWGLFSLFTGPRLDMFCALSVGYLYGFNWLKKIEPSERTLDRWESSSVLAPIVAMPGFVSQSSARSGTAWMPLSGTPSDRSSSTTTNSTTINPMAPRGGLAGFAPGGGGNTTNTSSAAGASSATTGFPGAGGHTLGAGAPKPANARDLAAARAAKLQGLQGGGAQAAPSNREREDDPFLDQDNV